VRQIKPHFTEATIERTIVDLAERALVVVS
jgi:hypothetical protein